MITMVHPVVKVMMERKGFNNTGTVNNNNLKDTEEVDTDSNSLCMVNNQCMGVNLKWVTVNR